MQPEKGHETLYVVREVTRNRVWFAEPLLSGTTAEIKKLFVRAKHLIRTLHLNVVLLDCRWQNASPDLQRSSTNSNGVGMMGSMGILRK